MREPPTRSAEGRTQHTWKYAAVDMEKVVVGGAF